MFQFAEVGGAVRDSLLGLDSKDVDFVAIPKNDTFWRSADEAFTGLVNHLKWCGFKGFETNKGEFILKPEFFTVRAQVPVGHPLHQRTAIADFVLARKDGPSTDGRRPDFVLPGTLLDDLERRDFTVNAMARMDNQIIDPFNGMSDLRNNLLRFVGDPTQRIGEDGLRVMRALRFHITKGFDIDADTWDAVNSDFAAEMLTKVSIERIWEELQRMFQADTLMSIDVLNALHSSVQKAIFRDGLRLMPTLKK